MEISFQNWTHCFLWARVGWVEGIKGMKGMTKDHGVIYVDSTAACQSAREAVRTT